MKGNTSVVALIGSFVVWSATWAPANEPSAPSVTGDYVEARNCDIWTGPCFSNGEVNTRGKNAVLAFGVQQGSWKGTRLDGLTLVAAIDAESTLSTDREGKVRSVIFVEEKATAEEEAALRALAAELAPRYLKDVVAVRRARILFKVEDGRAVLEVGKAPEIRVATRPLDPRRDSHCGNESRTYPALLEGSKTECQKTLENAYRGSDLGTKWSDPNTRSAAVGTFAR